jgi:hypothetical protein
MAHSSSLGSKSSTKRSIKSSANKSQRQIANELDKATHMDTKQLKQVITDTQTRGIHPQTI